MKTSTIFPNRVEKKPAQAGRRIITGLLVLLFWLALWQAAAAYINNALLLPAPMAVAERGAALLPSAAFWRVVGSSLFRIALGFALGLGAGLALAVLTHISRLARALLSPALKAVLATPVASFIILLLIWLKNGGAVPVAVAFLVVLPVVWRNIAAGIAATDSQLLEMARIFRLSRWRKLSRIYAPSLMPHLLSTCSVALGLAWKSGIAAEVISTPKSAIGSELQAGRVYLQIPDLFVWTIVVIVLSLLIEQLLMGMFWRLYRSWNLKED